MFDIFRITLIAHPLILWFGSQGFQNDPKIENQRLFKVSAIDIFDIYVLSHKFRKILAQKSYLPCIIWIELEKLSMSSNNKTKIGWTTLATVHKIHSTALFILSTYSSERVFVSSYLGLFLQFWLLSLKCRLLK